MRDGGNKKPSWPLALVGFLLGIWLAGFLLFLQQMPSKVEDEASRTDAIVVLTGGSERMTTGFALLEQGLADHLFVSGVHKGVDKADILRASHIEAPKDLLSRIELGHSADDTLGNAEETEAWVRDRNVRSLRLVTAAYHMPRSLWEFRRAMPGMIIIPNPVFPDRTRTGFWNYALLLTGEYSKYAVAIARNAFRKGDES